MPKCSSCARPVHSIVNEALPYSTFLLDLAGSRGKEGKLPTCSLVAECHNSLCLCAARCILYRGFGIPVTLRPRPAMPNLFSYPVAALKRPCGTLSKVTRRSAIPHTRSVPRRVTSDRDLTFERSGLDFGCGHGRLACGNLQASGSFGQFRVCLQASAFRCFRNSLPFNRLQLKLHSDSSAVAFLQTALSKAPRRRRFVSSRECLPPWRFRYNADVFHAAIGTATHAHRITNDTSPR